MDTPPPTLHPRMALGAVVLAGGRAARMGGADKATIELHGRNLLERALDAVIDATEVVVVGDQIPTERPVTFTREDPRHGGPAAALLAGLDALRGSPVQLAVLAVDMPRVTMGTMARVRRAAEGHDGAVLVDAEGRRALAYVLDTARLAAQRPPYGEEFGMSIRALLQGLDLVEVPGQGEETHDVDGWDDLRTL